MICLFYFYVFFCQGLVLDLETLKEKNEISTICAKLMQSLKVVQDVVTMKNEGQLHLLHEMGLKLWNLVVVKKLGKIIEREAVAQGFSHLFCSVALLIV